MIRFPFKDSGPRGHYWLDVFDPASRLREFCPVSTLSEIPFPEVRHGLWKADQRKRDNLVDAFRQSNLPLSKTQEAALKKLAHPDCMTLVTGQQPVALGGPLLVFNKILTAILAAEKCEKAWGIPVIPILWDGGDDHDLDEIDDLAWLDSSSEAQKCHLGLSQRMAGSAWRIPLDAGMFESFRAFIIKHHPQTGFREQLLQFLEGLWSQSAAWCDFFDGFWLEIFKEYPLLVARPWEAPFRRLAADVIERELSCPGHSVEAILSTSARVQASGYKPQVHKRDGQSLLFWSGPEGRFPVERQAGSYGIVEPSSGSFRTVEELLQDKTGCFSPSALLRPVVQDAILPTAAVALGPSELAYHCQIGPVYAHHGIPRPTILPRLSITLATSGQAKKLADLGLNWLDLQKNQTELMKTITSDQSMDPSLLELRDLLSHLERVHASLLEGIASTRHHLLDPARSQTEKAMKIYQQVESLLLRDEVRRQTTLQARLKSLKNALFPDDKLQERVLGLASFLCRNGFDWLPGLINEARGCDGASHCLYIISGGSEE